jgi:hypothetical protein
MPRLARDIASFVDEEHRKPEEDRVWDMSSRDDDGQDGRAKERQAQRRREGRLEESPLAARAAERSRLDVSIEKLAHLGGPHGVGSRGSRVRRAGLGDPPPASSATSGRCRGAPEPASRASAGDRVDATCEPSGRPLSAGRGAAEVAGQEKEEEEEEEESLGPVLEVRAGREEDEDDPRLGGSFSEPPPQHRP